jgi:hypothetical protein
MWYAIVATYIISGVIAFKVVTAIHKPPWYNWNIVESGVKHQTPTP